MTGIALLSGCVIKPGREVRGHREREATSAHAADGWKYELIKPVCL